MADNKFNSANEVDNFSTFTETNKSQKCEESEESDSNLTQCLDNNSNGTINGDYYHNTSVDEGALKNTRKSPNELMAEKHTDLQQTSSRRNQTDLYGPTIVKCNSYRDCKTDTCRSTAETRAHFHCVAAACRTALFSRRAVLKHLQGHLQHSTLQCTSSNRRSVSSRFGDEVNAKTAGSSTPSLLSRRNATLASTTKPAPRLDGGVAIHAAIAYMDSRPANTNSDGDDVDQRKYASAKMRHFSKESNKNNCDSDFLNSKYLAFNLSDLSQKRLDIAASPPFTQIAADDRATVLKRESTHSEGRLLLQPKQDQHNLYLHYSMLAANVLCTTSTTTSETCSLTPSKTKPSSIVNSERFNRRHVQQHDPQPTNVNITEYPKREEADRNHIESTAFEESYEATFLQKENHCKVTELSDTDSTIPSTTAMGVSSPIQITSIDGFFNRKRGRPPKNRFVEVYKNTHQTPQAVFTSFKLEKNAATSNSHATVNEKALDYDYAHRNRDRTLLPTPATVRPRFTLIPQLPMYANDSGSEVKFKSEIYFQPKAQRTPPIITDVDDFVHLNPDEVVDLKRADRETVRDFMQKMETQVALAAQKHSAEAAATDIAAKLLKRDMETLKEQQEHSSNLVLNTRDLEHRGGDVHIHPAGPQQTCVQQLRDRDSVSLTSNSDNPLDYGGTKSNSLKKVSVVRAVGTFFPDCKEMASNASNNLHSETSFGRVTTKPVMWSARGTKASFKRKRVQDYNKHVRYETFRKSIDGNEFGVPEDLSTRIKKEIPISSNCSRAKDFSGILKNMGDETTIANKAKTAEKKSTILDNELDLHNKVAIGLHLKQLLNLYQMQNQQNVLQQNQPSTAINSIPVDNNILRYFSILWAASNNVQPQASSLVQPITTIPSAIGRLQQVSPDFETVTLAKPDTPTTTRTAALTAAAVTHRNLLDIMALCQGNRNNCSRTNTTAANSVPTTRSSDDSALFTTALRKKYNMNMPTGYLKFRFNEDCGFENCGYRQRQSHFHCDRVDCHYSFCDKTRFVQHTARHERLDTLMGADFQQYRSNLQCGFTNCVYQLHEESANTKKSSHFHCLKCPFTCTDTNKVVSHRRLHNKMDYIRSVGFCKVLNTENCAQRYAALAPDADHATTVGGVVFESLKDTTLAMASSCIYNKKLTHFHCLLCGCGVASRSQLSAHRQKSCNTIYKNANATATSTLVVATETRSAAAVSTDTTTTTRHPS